MTATELSIGTEPRTIPRHWIVTGGRILLGVALLLAWEWAARAFGTLFFAPPLATAQRIVEMAGNGKLFTDIVATLRVSALGFVIGCVCGVALPFLLRRSDRATQAIELGIPCLIEKPLARNFTEATDLVRNAEQAGVLLASVANKRFSPPYAMARALIDDGVLKSAPTVFTGKFTLGYPYVDLLEGGTVHLLDLVQWFMGPVSKLHARGIRRDDGGLLTYEFDAKADRTGIPSLLAAMRDAGIAFKDLDTHQSSLEDIFVGLIHHERVAA